MEQKIRQNSKGDNTLDSVVMQLVKIQFGQGQVWQGDSERLVAMADFSPSMKKTATKFAVNRKKARRK